MITERSGFLSIGKCFVPICYRLLTGTIFCIEEEGICNSLVVTITPFIDITAFPTKERLAPLRTKLPAHQAIGGSPPDLSERMVLQIPKDLLLLRIISAGTYYTVPMNSRIIPQVFAWTPLESDAMETIRIVFESLVLRILGDEGEIILFHL
jgi:hypothetical protein